jgi:hypothetical protein
MPQLRKDLFMGRHNTGEASTQAADYQPKHASTGPSANNAVRIIARLIAGRAAGRQ